MERVASNDRVRSTFEADHGRLWRSVLAYTGDPEVASDAVAEAFAPGPVETFDGTYGRQALAPDHRGRVIVRALDDDDADWAGPLFAYDPGSDTWTPTDLAIDIHHPTFGVAAGTIVVPDEAAPFLGPVPP